MCAAETVRARPRLAVVEANRSSSRTGRALFHHGKGPVLDPGTVGVRMAVRDGRSYCPGVETPVPVCTLLGCILRRAPSAHQYHLGVARISGD